MQEFFSDNYFEAREKFLANARENSLEINSFKLEKAKGPDDKDVFMDCAYTQGINKNNLLVLISGTHGPEGYCGSAIQSRFMKSGALAKTLEKCSAGIIHAHNPFGFAWDSRFNEDNIDLNRNYIEDFSNCPQNPAYDELANWALPEKFDDESIKNATVQLMVYSQNNGFAALQNALTAGQYRHQKGVYFGGFAPSWSNQTINSILDKWTAGIKRLIVIDFHTGLGPFGHGEILSDFPIDSIEFARVKEVFGEEATSTKSQGSISAAVNGSLDSGICRKYASLNPVCVALEFGTLDPLSVFKATQGTSWAQSYDNLASEMGVALRKLSRDAFYPQSDEWKQKILLRGSQVIERALEKL